MSSEKKQPKVPKDEFDRALDGLISTKPLPVKAIPKKRMKKTKKGQ